MIDRIKRSSGAKSHDEVIENLARRRTSTPPSFFGTLKASKPFVRLGEDEHLRQDCVGVVFLKN